MQRKEYVEALKTERETVLGRGGSPERLAAIDAELDRFGEAPKRRRRETSTTPPAPAPDQPPAQ